jgi:hypothetical protein
MKSSLDERTEASTLCPRAKGVTAKLQWLAANPQVNSSLDVKAILADLRLDMDGIEKAYADATAGKWPDHVQAEHDDKVWEAAIHRARLTIWETATTVLSHALGKMGYESSVLEGLTKALASAQVCSGNDWRKLEPARGIRSALNPNEVQDRAIVTAIARLHPSPADREQLYVAVEQQYNWPKGKAKQIVHDDTAGKLKDRTYIDLRSVWEQHIEHKLSEAKARGQTIAIPDLLMNAY